MPSSGTSSTCRCNTASTTVTGVFTPCKQSLTEHGNLGHRSASLQPTDLDYWQDWPLRQLQPGRRTAAISTKRCQNCIQAHRLENKQHIHALNGSLKHAPLLLAAGNRYVCY